MDETEDNIKEMRSFSVDKFEYYGIQVQNPELMEVFKHMLILKYTRYSAEQLLQFPFFSKYQQ
jgi:hypothetical protein